MKASDMIAILSRFNKDCEIKTEDEKFISGIKCYNNKIIINTSDKKEDELMTQIDITMRFGHYGNFHKM